MRPTEINGGAHEKIQCGILFPPERDELEMHRVDERRVSMWNGGSKGACPSDRRIVQDVENWVDVLHHVYEKRGISVEGRRQGRRLAQSPDTGQENRGGPRVKGDYKPNARWEHEDVATVKAADIARSESTHAHRIGMES